MNCIKSHRQQPSMESKWHKHSHSIMLLVLHCSRWFANFVTRIGFVSGLDLQPAPFDLCFGFVIGRQCSALPLGQSAAANPTANQFANTHRRSEARKLESSEARKLGSSMLEAAQSTTRPHLLAPKPALLDSSGVRLLCCFCRFI